MKNKYQKRIFLDYASITPVDKKVEKEIARVQSKFWGNPSSLHLEGEEAKEILNKSRVEAARILHCKSSEIIFTSGGTESLNTAIFGVVKAYQNQFGLPHIILSSVEHPAVLEPIKSLLRDKKIETSFINPNQNGLINPESIKNEIKQNTVLVIVMHGNNEIGTVQPIAKIARVIKEYREKNNTKAPYLLVDASQTFMFEDVSLERLQADILVLDGIKIYGPRATGVLAVRLAVPMGPLMFGGGQENGLRSGTENVAGIAGFSLALKISSDQREKESKRLKTLRDYAIEKIINNFPNASLNGDLENRLPNNINICFPGTDSEFLVIKLDTLGFAVSAASACHNLSLENSSYVIESLGKENCASSSLRFTLGRQTKKSDIDKLILALKKVI